MKHAKRNILAALSLTMTSIMVISCTKEVPYKEVYKEKVHTKSELDTSAEYIYVSSSDTASSDDLGAAKALPYWQGSEKIVKFRFTEKSLQAVEVNEEARLKDNATNDRIVLEIPVKHTEFRCAEDRYKKCTNREEENSEINWSQKSKFVPDFENIKSVGLSMLPVEMDKVFGGSCYNEASSRFLNYELTGDALNIQVEKTFTANVDCLEKMGINITSLKDLQSQIVYHYSFVKAKALSTPNYQAIKYPKTDEGTFGFFTTEVKRYDADLNRTEKGKTVFMNRWNPDRKEIVYYLSDNFDKPEFAAIKKSTELAFERVNNGMKAAGMTTQLVLKGTGNKQPGDIRNSMIVLVEDPIAAGPLGYGPTVAHPRTGEIMSGRVAMYYGNLLQNVKFTYDEVVRELRYNKNAAAKAKKANNLASSINESGETLSKSLAYKSQMSAYAQNGLSKKLGAKIAKAYSSNSSKLAAKSNLSQTVSVNNLAKLSKNSLEKSLLKTSNTTANEDVLAAMSKHCNYPAELFPFDEAVKNGLQGKLGQDLKLWAQLSETEKQEVITLITPEIWLPTLVHELGHNLGLRHNFGASEDKSNFYTKEELAQMSVKHEVPYSSVMDYGYSELNLLPTLGKYDIAALRFGYKREVKNATGESLAVKTTLGDLEKQLGSNADGSTKLAEFRYCSDEHVDANPGCKRFDKGTTLSEIADHMIKQYNDLYEFRNFRNGRENFSQMSDAAYASSVRARFTHLRAFMERYESLKYRFRLGDDDKEWTDIEFLKDLKTAALKSGRFFLEVMTTPDITCAAAEVKNPNTLVMSDRLDNINPNAVDCFSVQLNPDYVMKAQFGKSFNHRKDPNSDNHYADQIDVRGIYADKMVAAEMLFKRTVGSSLYDDTQDNYLDIADLTEEITSTVNQILLDQVNKMVDFKNAKGQVVTTQSMPIRMFSAPSTKREASPVHWIKPAMDASVAKKLGLPMQAISYQEVLLKTMSTHMSSSKDHWTEDRQFMDSFRVYKTTKATQLDKESDPSVKDIGALRIYALEPNIFANEVIRVSDMLAMLEKLSDEDVQKLLEERVANDKILASGGSIMTTKSSFSPGLAGIQANVIASYTQQLLDRGLIDYLATILPEGQ